MIYAEDIFFHLLTPLFSYFAKMEILIIYFAAFQGKQYYFSFHYFSL